MTTEYQKCTRDGTWLEIGDKVVANVRYTFGAKRGKIRAPGCYVQLNPLLSRPRRLTMDEAEALGFDPAILRDAATAATSHIW